MKEHMSSPEAESCRDLASEIAKLQGEIITMINNCAQKALTYENKPGDPDWMKEEHQKKVLANLEEVKAKLDEGITTSL